MNKVDRSKLFKQCIINLAALYCCFMISSCSNSEEQKASDSIEKTTENIAREAVERIQAPIEKAKLAKKLQENHEREIEKAKERL